MIIERHMRLFGTAAEWRSLLKWHRYHKRDYKQGWQQYMQSIAWQKKRAEAFAHHGERCMGCHFALAVQVHHLTYKRIGDEPMSDLAVLCVDCHRRHHDGRQPFWARVLPGGVDPFSNVASVNAFRGASNHA